MTEVARAEHRDQHDTRQSDGERGDSASVDRAVAVRFAFIRDPIGERSAERE